MPIKIYKGDESFDELAWLCDEEWELPAQVDALEKWLMRHPNGGFEGKVIADIAYSARPGAFGGGATLSSDSMGKFSTANVNILLSEYPQSSDED